LLPASPKDDHAAFASFIGRAWQLLEDDVCNAVETTSGELADLFQQHDNSSSVCSNGVAGTQQAVAQRKLAQMQLHTVYQHVQSFVEQLWGSRVDAQPQQGPWPQCAGEPLTPLWRLASAVAQAPLPNTLGGTCVDVAQLACSLGGTEESAVRAMLEYAAFLRLVEGGVGISTEQVKGLVEVLHSSCSNAASQPLVAALRCWAVVAALRVGIKQAGRQASLFTLLASIGNDLAGVIVGGGCLQQLAAEKCIPMLVAQLEHLHAPAEGIIMTVDQLMAALRTAWDRGDNQLCQHLIYLLQQLMPSQKEGLLATQTAAAQQLVELLCATARDAGNIELQRPGCDPHRLAEDLLRLAMECMEKSPGFGWLLAHPELKLSSTLEELRKLCPTPPPGQNPSLATAIKEFTAKLLSGAYAPVHETETLKQSFTLAVNNAVVELAKEYERTRSAISTTDASVQVSCDRDKVAELEERPRQGAQREADLQQQKQQLATQLGLCEAELTVLRPDLAAMRQQVLELRGQLDAAQRESRVQAAKLDAMVKQQQEADHTHHTQLQDLQRERDALEQQLAAADDTNAAKDASLSEQGQQLQDLQQQRDALAQQRDTLKQQRDTLKQQRDTLKQQRDTLKQQMAAAKKANAAKDAIMREQTQQLQTLQQERDTLEQQLAAAEKTNAAMREQAQQLHTLEQQAAEAAAKVAAARQAAYLLS
jgi:hypothetical protein